MDHLDSELVSRDVMAELLLLRNSIAAPVPGHPLPCKPLPMLLRREAERAGTHTATSNLQLLTGSYRLNAQKGHFK